MYSQAAQTAVPEEHGAFALIVRGDTTVLEEYTRTARLLEGVVLPQVSGAKFGWARYRVEFARSGEPRRAELHLGRVGTSPDSAVAAQWNVVIRGGVLTETGPDREPLRLRVPSGVVPVFPPSMVLDHELIRQAMRRNRHRGDVEIPVYPFAADGRIFLMKVSWAAPHTVLLAYENSPAARYRVDEQGRIQGGQTSEGEFVAVRLR